MAYRPGPFSTPPLVSTPLDIKGKVDTARTVCLGAITRYPWSREVEYHALFIGYGTLESDGVLYHTIIKQDGSFGPTTMLLNDNASTSYRAASNLEGVYYGLSSNMMGPVHSVFGQNPIMGICVRDNAWTSCYTFSIAQDVITYLGDAGSIPTTPYTDEVPYKPMVYASRYEGGTGYGHIILQKVTVTDMGKTYEIPGWRGNPGTSWQTTPNQMFATAFFGGVATGALVYKSWRVIDLGNGGSFRYVLWRDATKHYLGWWNTADGTASTTPISTDTTAVTLDQLIDNPNAGFWDSVTGTYVIHFCLGRLTGTNTGLATYRYMKISATPDNGWMTPTVTYYTCTLDFTQGAAFQGISGNTFSHTAKSEIVTEFIYSGRYAADRTNEHIAVCYAYGVVGGQDRIDAWTKDLMQSGDWVYRGTIWSRTNVAGVSTSFLACGRRQEVLAAPSFLAFGFGSLNTPTSDVEYLIWVDWFKPVTQIISSSVSISASLFVEPTGALITPAFLNSSVASSLRMTVSIQPEAYPAGAPYVPMKEMMVLFSGGVTNISQSLSLGGARSGDLGGALGSQKCIPSVPTSGVTVMYGDGAALGVGLVSWDKLYREFYFTDVNSEEFSVEVKEDGKYRLGPLVVNVVMSDVPETPGSTSVTVSQWDQNIIDAVPAEERGAAFANYRCYWIYNSTQSPFYNVVVSLFDAPQQGSITFGTEFSTSLEDVNPAAIEKRWLTHYTGGIAIMPAPNVDIQRDFASPRGPETPARSGKGVQISDGVTTGLPYVLADEFDSTNLLADVDWGESISWTSIGAGAYKSFWLRRQYTGDTGLQEIVESPTLLITYTG